MGEVVISPVAIYNGECLDIMEILAELDVKVNAVICDPPSGKSACKWDSVIPLTEHCTKPDVIKAFSDANYVIKGLGKRDTLYKDEFFALTDKSNVPRDASTKVWHDIKRNGMWHYIDKLTNDNTPIVFFGTEPFSSQLRLSNIAMFKYDWIWHKPKGTGFLNANKQPMRNHETISVFYKKQPVYNPQKTKGHERKQSYRSKKSQTDVYGKMEKDNTYDSTERYPKSIQTFSSDTQKSSLHSTQKPLALMKYLIETYTNKGDAVLDLSMGSGTTGVACIETGRRFIGIELNEAIFRIAKERIDSALMDSLIPRQGEFVLPEGTTAVDIMDLILELRKLRNLSRDATYIEYEKHCIAFHSQYIQTLEKIRSYSNTNRAFATMAYYSIRYLETEMTSIGVSISRHQGDSKKKNTQPMI